MIWKVPSCFLLSLFDPAKRKSEKERYGSGCWVFMEISGGFYRVTVALILVLSVDWENYI